MYFSHEVSSRPFGMGSHNPQELGDNNHHHLRFLSTETSSHGMILKDTLPKTDSSHLKTGQNLKGNNRIPTIHFQVQKC